MEKVRVEISAELARAAELNPADPSAQAAHLLAEAGPKSTNARPELSMPAAPPLPALSTY